MKTSTTNSKSKFLFCALLLLPALAQAKLVGKVHAVKGEAFVLSQGRTEVLKKDMDIADGAQIMVSDDAQVTVGDFYDRRYHIMQGSQLVMQDRNVTLQKGGVWTQSLSGKVKTTLTTANMLVGSQQGELIATYDTAYQKSQLTVMMGEADLASPREPAFRYAISAGFFSVASPESDDGYPRAPTRLGYESLMKLVGQFPGVKSLDAGVASAQSQAAQRSIASVAEKKGEIIHMRTVEKSASAPTPAGGIAQKYFLQRTQQKLNSPLVKGHTAPVRVLGYQGVTASGARKPASTMKTQPQGSAPSGNTSDFLKSYELHHRQQPKNPQEVQRLIDDLKSY